MPLTPFSPLHTARLTLRPVAATDLADLFEINGDPQVTRFLPYATWQSSDDGVAWLARMDTLVAAGTAQQLVLERRADAKVVGTMLLFKFDEASARIELGYVLGRVHWRQGLMHEAVAAACAHAFGALNIRRIEAEVDPLNAASCALLRGAGFRLEGTLRQRWVVRGTVSDSNLYGRLSSDAG